MLPDNEELTVVVVYSIRYNNETCAERPALSEAEVWFAPDPATGRESVRTEQFHNPYLAMGNNPVVYVDPDGEFVVNLIGAGISVLTNGISNSINGQGFFDNAGSAAIMGAIGGAMSFGIGQATMGLKGLGKIGAQTLAHGHLGGIMTTANGGSYGSGFAAGGLGSLAGTGVGTFAGQVKSDVLKAGITTAGGAAAGGMGAELTGGNFWDGARNEAISAGLNHAYHSIQTGILKNQLQKVFENYPTGDQDGIPMENGNYEIHPREAFKSVSPAALEAYENGTYSNACATRLSLAFAKAGVRIPNGYGGLKDVNGNRIIISAKQMHNFMSTKYGQLMTNYSSSTSNNVIYIGLTRPGMGYSGHVTIIRPGFNSSTYSSSMNSMYFWSIP